MDSLEIEGKTFPAQFGVVCRSLNATWYKTFSEIWSGGVERSGARNYEIEDGQAVPRPMLLI